MTLGIRWVATPSVLLLQLQIHFLILALYHKPNVQIGLTTKTLEPTVIQQMMKSLRLYPNQTDLITNHCITIVNIASSGELWRLIVLLVSPHS